MSSKYVLAIYDMSRTIKYPIIYLKRLTPLRRFVNYSKVFLDAKWARGGSGRGFWRSFDLDETFGADGLIAASRMIDIGGVILQASIVSDNKKLIFWFKEKLKRTKKQIGHSTASLYRTFSLAFIRSTSARWRSLAESTAND
jgi:hypothetical protein